MPALEDVQPVEVSICRKLAQNKNSSVFLVNVRHVTCVMKVHHGRGPAKYYEPKNRELDLHIRELKAYTRLKQHGICDRGVVPDFLGSMRRFDPSHLLPHLRKFVGDEVYPSALFIEYIPDMEMITLENYTPERLRKFADSIREIHQAMVLHDDIKPRNMMVISGSSDRVVWIDFDRAETFGPDDITARQRQLLDEEEQSIDGYCDYFALDFAKGKLEKMYLFYCT